MNYKQLLIGVAIGVVLALGAGFLVSRMSMGASNLGAVVGVGEVQTNTFWFYNGLYAGATQQFSVSSAGAVTAAGGVTVGSSGTKVSAFACYTATWNPGTVTSSTYASTTLSTPGVALGDIEYASIATSTQNLTLEANVLSAGSSTAILSVPSTGVSSAVATTTVKICYIH